jgi:signal transduction histidine kinase
MLLGISIVLVTFVSVILGAIVLANNPAKLSNRVFAVLSSFMALWILANFFSDRFWITEFWVRVTFAAAVGAVGGFAIFANVFPTGILNWRRKLFIGFIIISALVSASSLVVQGIYQRSSGPTGFNVYHGPLYTAYFAVILIAMTYGIVSVVRNLRRARGADKVQLQYFSIGSILAVLIGVSFNLILPIILGGSEFSRYGFFAALPLLGFTSYAIIKHRLFNIRAVVARSLAYVFSIIVFAFIYAFVVFGLAQGVFLKNILTTQLSQQIFNVVLAVILAFTFPTIRRFFERITDRIFYRDRYDPQRLVSDIGRVLASEILLEKLAAKVLTIIQTQIHLSNGNIVVMGEDGIFYQTHADRIQQLYHAPELAKFNKGITVADELANNERRDILERHNVRAVFPLRTKESFVGYLLLGEKQSGDIFSSQDIQTLTIIADELAIAINNARSYQEIQRFNETLREKVRQATAELRHANVELKELDKAKDEFISMASHQLRTPLTAVRGYTSMVMDGDFGKVSGDQKDTLKQAFDAATRMTRLVDDLLNVSRIQSGKFRIERADVDLNKVLPEEVSMLASAAEMKHVALTFHKPKSAVPVLQIDEGKTRQCLMNLMDNAIYYSAAAASGGKVEVYLEADKDWVSFKVMDNGIGVPKSEQDKLFKKFYRAPNAQKTRPDGTGLGLFLVGKVVKDQGGEIIFESEEGKGSTFGFRLPVKASGEGVGVIASKEEPVGK